MITEKTASEIVEAHKRLARIEDALRRLKCCSAVIRVAAVDISIERSFAEDVLQRLLSLQRERLNALMKTALDEFGAPDPRQNPVDGMAMFSYSPPAFGGNGTASAPSDF